jgi:hypothetical protein
LFDHGPVAEVVVERDAGVVDENVEGLDRLDRRRYLRRLVTSKISGVTCSSGWARGWRVPA